MKTKIGIWGSCATRDIFRSEFNDYNEYFEIVYELERISLISLMGYGNGFEYNEEDIQIQPLNDKNKYRSELLRRDLSKDYLKILGENIDYLIIDEFFEAYFGIIKMYNTYITYNYWDYPDTKFYESINKDNILTLNNNFLEYYALWKNNCDKFFDFFHKSFPNVKIVLNKVKLASKILKDDGSYYIDEEFQKREQIFNPLINLLENYLEKNHNVIVVDCTQDVVVNENHMCGMGEVNYHDDFYINAFEKILEIINVDKCVVETVNNDFYLINDDFEFNSNFEESVDSYSDLNDVMVNKFKDLSPESKLKEYLDIKKFLFEEASVNNNFIEPYRLKDYLNFISKNNLGDNINIQKDSFNELIKINGYVAENKEFLEEQTKNIENKINSQYFNEHAEFLIKYLESRIDIKNYGDENNDIVMLTSNDPSLNITRPSWFDDMDGIGTVITSVKGDLNLSFKCINKGKLCLGFKSIDYKDKKGNQIPVYIDYTELIVNGEVIIDESNVLWHNSPLIFEKDVEDGEIINVVVKWNPINYESNFFIDNNSEKVLETFHNARIDVKNYGKENNDLILLSCDDHLCNVYKPNWLKNKFGIGTVVSSSNENINMSFKCVGDGILEIDFRSIDLKYDDFRIPIFIDYTKIKVDDTDIIASNFTTWHDNPFIFKQKVKNNQIINIQAEWKSLGRKSNLSLLKQHNHDLNIYSEARVDIKNYGNENNSISMIDENVSFYNISRPEWFSDFNGIGFVISSDNGELNMSFECINDGKLKIDFKSIDFKDNDNNRIPIYIDYKEIEVDGESIIDGSTVLWHDNPLVYEKDVKNGQIVNVKLKWDPLNSNSNCQNTLINNNSKDEVIKKLKNELEGLNIENKELNNLKLEILGSNPSKINGFFAKIKNIIKM